MPVTRTTARVILTAAAAYNVSGGLAIIFLLDLLAPVIGFEPVGNMLFRLFVGGTAVTFGVAYGRLARRETPRAPVLFYGTALKYWAFVSAIICHVGHGLSLSVLILFGVANLLFALLFTLILAG